MKFSARKGLQPYKSTDPTKGISAVANDKNFTSVLLIAEGNKKYYSKSEKTTKFTRSAPGLYSGLAYIKDPKDKIRLNQEVKRSSRAYPNQS